MVTLTHVIFVTHAYETVFLIHERESDLLRVARLERMQVEAELGALKAQIDPHFLPRARRAAPSALDPLGGAAAAERQPGGQFNSLTTLGHLITHDAQRGRTFCDTLASVYRYVLASRGRDLVGLREELEFVRAYHRLLALRFGPAITLEITPALDEAAGRWALPPLDLQTLLENAVKHNQMGEDAPLAVQMDLNPTAGYHFRVANPEWPRRSTLPGAGLGLRNLDERCRLLTGRGLRVRHEAGRFEVDVPVTARLEAPAPAHEGALQP